MKPSIDPIGLFVTRSAKAVSRAFDDALADQGGTLPTWLVMAAVAGGLRDSQRTIAADLGIEGATLTHHLRRMEADGLVRRERDPQDKRAQLVELTDEGRHRFGSLLATVQDFDRQLRTGFTDAELATLRELLGRLVENVRPSERTNDPATPPASPLEEGAPT
jgi:MarR family transcriptional regulator for hemolysin